MKTDTSLSTAVTAGVLTALVLVVLGVYTGFLTFINRFPTLLEQVSYLWQALGSSFIFFLLNGIAYGVSVVMLKKALQGDDSIKIRYLTQINNFTVYTFFFIGVIYTAIGMNSALESAIGGVAADGMQDMSAWEVLSNLVNGGITTALITTIVGGVGNQIMKFINIIYLGKIKLERTQEEYDRLYGLIYSIDSSLEEIKRK